MRAMSVAGSRRRALRDFYLTPVASRPESNALRATIQRLHCDQQALVNLADELLE
jgi:hypothetical protein